ncbi:MAG: hypothetical protein ACE5Q6_04355 [Dehalococcoidia bacterium]
MGRVQSPKLLHRRGTWRWLTFAIAAAGFLITLAVVLSLSKSGDVALLEGDLAPDFALPNARGQTVNLGQLLEGQDALVLVFYRGFF